jgi:hypothetical protein
MLNRKHFIILIVIIIVLFIAYIFVGRQIPIHSSNMKVDSERIFCLLGNCICKKK